MAHAARSGEPIDDLYDLVRGCEKKTLRKKRGPKRDGKHPLHVCLPKAKQRPESLKTTSKCVGETEPTVWNT